MCSEVLQSDPENVNALKDRAEAYIQEEHYEEGESVRFLSVKGQTNGSSLIPERGTEAQLCSDVKSWLNCSAGTLRFMPGSERSVNDGAKNTDSTRNSQISEAPWLAECGLVRNSSCWNPWKSGFREENQRCLVLLHPSVESSITSVLGRNRDRWNLKLADHEPCLRLLNSDLELFGVEQPPSDWCRHVRGNGKKKS